MHDVFVKPLFSVWVFIFWFLGANFGAKHSEVLELRRKFGNPK